MPKDICSGCDGKKVQKRTDGINILCPVCGGTGIHPIPVISKPKPIKPSKFVNPPVVAMYAVLPPLKRNNDD